MIQFVIFWLCAAVALATGTWYDFTDFEFVKWILIMSGITFGFAGSWAMFREIMQDVTANTKELEWAKAKPIIDITNAMRGISDTGFDLISRQLYFEIEGVLGEGDILIWTLNLPGGKVPLEFVDQFLTSSMNTAPYAFPVRDHNHRDFTDFKNVERLLEITTNAFKYKGWLEDAAGPYSAKLVAGETFTKIGERFGLHIE